jgi:AsmA protein
MQQTDLSPAAASNKPRKKRRSRIRRFVAVYYIVLAIILLALIPPYISLNRYQRRIAASISQSLGRPVHLDSVNLTLLPFPGFTITNLVVSEDPAFGNEPIIRAMSVRANLRVSSLWRRQVEFSSISFTEPSVNLVHLPNGKWNLESILLQAAHIQAAPTAQKTPGPAPRFPYIEATGARLNLKLGTEKTPFSLTDTEFALWLPDPQQWHLRIEGHPARTDTIVTDAGLFTLEGTLSRAADLADVPINLNAEWRAVPLGEASRLILGHDTGLRGDLALTARAQGTFGNSTLISNLVLSALRLSEFVPEQRLSVDLQCQATATNTFHTFNTVQCTWPPAGSTQPIALIATIPDVRDLNTATGKIGTPALPMSTTVDWLRTGSDRIPADLTATGTLSGSAEFPAGLANLPTQWDTHITTNFQVPTLTLQSPHSGLAATTLTDLTFHASMADPTVTTAHTRRTPVPAPTRGLIMDPTPITLGGKDPATIEGRFDTTGYTLHLTGMALLSQLSALGRALPQFGDGLQPALPTDRAATTPTRLDLTATRPWGAPQTWQDNTARPAAPRPRPRRAVGK